MKQRLKKILSFFMVLSLLLIFGQTVITSYADNSIEVYYQRVFPNQDPDQDPVPENACVLPVDAVYPKNQEIKIVATPSNYYEFSGWEHQGGSISEDPYDKRKATITVGESSEAGKMYVKAVLAKKLTITVKDQTYPYDGQPHGEPDPVYYDPAVIKKKVTVEGLLDGDTVTSITLTGKTESEISEYKEAIEATGVVIKNASVREVTEKYKVTFVPGDLTIYGTVSFDANGGSGEMKDVSVVEDVYKLPECAFTAPGGKTFRCWLVDNEERDPGTEIMMNENKVVTAQWKDKDEPHVHDPKLVEKKEATCTEAGNKTYYKCSCGKWFEDKTALKEITDKSSITIKALGHDWDSGVVTKAPTATKDGIRTYTCRRDSSHTKTEAIPARGRRSSGGSEHTVGPAPGQWMKDEAGWHFKENGALVKNTWKYLEYNGESYWYFFDEDGNMKTGWLEWNGQVYYLNPESDGWMGRMLTGLQIIEGKSYYFETESGETQGQMYRNRKTPEGYWMTEDGIWDGLPAEPDA